MVPAEKPDLTIFSKKSPISLVFHHFYCTFAATFHVALIVKWI